jgi:prepilin-type N-terminal cleavage/methylation domain-containing protein
MIKDKHLFFSAGFTLIELLIVIAILAVLATAAVLMLNPAGMLAETRDSTRMTDLNAINQALGFLRYYSPSSDFGSSTNVYVSIPSDLADCGYGTTNPLNLPSIPSTYSYVCKTEADYRRIDGNGWIPVDFTKVSGGSPLVSLPVDPVNDATRGLYYTYLGGGWTLNSMLESSRYLSASARTDGGVDDARYETGVDFSLWSVVSGLVGYWRMDESLWTIDCLTSTVMDSSENAHHGKSCPNISGPAGGVVGKIGNAGRFDGANTYVNAGNINLPSNQVTVSWWMNMVDNSGLTPDMGLAPIIIDWMKGSPSDYRDGTVLCYIKTNPAWSGGSFTTNGVICTYSSTGPQLNDVGTNFNNWYGSWHFITYTVNGTNAKIYVDGNLENSIVGTGNINPQNDIFSISKRMWTYGVTLNGTIDEVRVFSRALTAVEIKAMYDATK